MSVYYRTGKRWQDADGLLKAWDVAGEQLTLILDLGALVAARKDESITQSEWRVNGTAYRAVTTSVLPACRQMRLVAERNE